MIANQSINRSVDEKKGKMKMMIITLEEEEELKEREAEWTERSAALRTIKVVSATMWRWMAKEPAKLQAVTIMLIRLAFLLV